MSVLKFDKALVKPTGYRNHIEVQRYDLPAPLTLRQHTTDEMVYRQVFESPHYRVRFESDPRVIIDAGAHCGYASVLFAHRFPEAHIIALEPAPDNFELLQKNTEAYPRITALNAALWSHPGKLTLSDPGKGNWAYRVGAAKEDATGDVVATSIPALMEQFSLNEIDLLKIDIEGAEKEVFHHASAWIDKVRAIAAELHEHQIQGTSRYFFNATHGFDFEWYHFENQFVSRGHYMQPPEGSSIEPVRILQPATD